MVEAQPRLRRPRGLLIDAMGTLFGLAAPVAQVYAQVARDMGVAVKVQLLDAAFRRAFADAPPLAFPDATPNQLPSEEWKWWQGLIGNTFRLAGSPLSPALLSQLTEKLFAHYANASTWVVYEDVPRYLERWHDAGLKLAVVSNFDGRLPGLLQDLGLRQWFDAVLVSSRDGAAKPDPALFHQALRQLDMAPEDVWHLGDNPADWQGAEAAGIHCVLLIRPLPAPLDPAIR